MKQKWFCPVMLLALGLCSLPATASSVLFTDLGSSNPLYNCCIGWTLTGSASGPGFQDTVANLFTVTGSGSLPLSQIDLAVGYVSGVNTFYAAIWTDNAGLPGAQVSGAFWNSLAATNAFGGCCGLVTISGISGVDLTGGQMYFLVLGPVSTSGGQL